MSEEVSLVGCCWLTLVRVRWWEGEKEMGGIWWEGGRWEGYGGREGDGRDMVGARE
jgi:hypothetical protein